MHVLFKQCVTLAKIINQKKRLNISFSSLVSVVGSFFDQLYLDSGTT